MDRFDLSSISVRTFYGHPLPGVAATDLGPGVNVVFGPNGQGKTTLARAIHGVLWPETVEGARPTYSAAFHYRGDEWRVDFDAGTPRYRCEGAPADRLPLPDSSYRDRYELSLSDLLLADGDAFADLVRRDASGGVDLEVAAGRLGFKAAPAQRLKVTTEAEEAARAVQRRQHQLDALRAREQALGEIAERAAEATDSAELAEVYRLLDDAGDRLEAAQAAAHVVSEFPAALANVAPDTQERYDDLSIAVRKAEIRRAEVEAQRAEARAALAEHGWDEVELPESAEMRARQAEVEAATRVLEGAQTTRSSSADRERRAREALGGHLEVAPTVDVGALGDVAAFARRSGQLEGRAIEYQARRDAARARLNAVRFHDADLLGRGADLLRRWLAHTTEAQARVVALPPRPVWVGAVVFAIAGGAMLFMGPFGSGWLWGGLAALVAALVLSFVAYRLGKELAAPENPSDAAEVAYNALSLSAPESWTIPAVKTLLDRLERQILDQKERVLWQDSVDENERMLLSVEESRADLEAEAARIGEVLGLPAPETPEQLHLLARNVLAWQESARDLGVADTAESEAATALDAALGLFNNLLDGLPLEAAGDAASAAGLAARVAREADERARLRAEVARLDESAGGATERLDEAESARDAFLSRLGLEEPAADDVAELVSMYPAYVAAVEESARGQAISEEASARARAHSRFTNEIGSLSRADLAAARTAAETRAARRDEWLEEKASIQTLVGEARRASAMASAHAEHARALDALERAYDQQADALVGHALAAYVEEETRDQHLPQVFKRAREVLAEITDDRFRLDFDADEGTFQAYDAMRGRTFELDELSSGTRLQLLLAVRLAFAEQQEVGVRLPLLLDEALANSDDERASAIVEAVLRLCRQGRQVFYFTAQEEEVSKWRRLSKEHADVECRFFGLPSNAALVSVDLEATPGRRTTRRVPSAEGHDMEGYAREIGVPGWTAWDALDALHVWYLLDTPEQVEACLRRGYTTWGQLRAAVERGKPVPVEVAHVGLRARAVGAWREAWRQGRGRRLSRAALEDAGLAPDLFDDVWPLYSDGDAQVLLDALEGGDASERDVEQFGAFLADEGYLSPDPTLDDDEIRRRIAETVPHPDALEEAFAVLDRVRARAEAVAG